MNQAQGVVYVYTKSGSIWSLQQILSDTNGAASDKFGSSVALDSIGDTALIGAFYKKIGSNVAQGAAYIFSRSGTVWSQQQVLSDTITGTSGDIFGSSVALNSLGDIAIIGANLKNVGSNTSQGVAYIFNKNGSLWSQQQILSDTISGAAYDWFGSSVALNSAGDIAIIGAFDKKIGANDAQGAAYIFSKSGTVWSQQQILSDTINGSAIDHFGWKVALNNIGNTALISAHEKQINSNSHQGAVYLFNRSGAVWSQQQVLSDTTGTSSDVFGFAVALNATGDIALIGASGKKIGYVNSCV